MGGTTSRFGVTTWTKDSDSFTYSQMQQSHNNIDSKVAGFVQGVGDPDSNFLDPIDYAGFFYYSSTDSSKGVLYYSNGVDWFLATVTDHDSASGLGDDDHSHYLLTDGSRAVVSLSVAGDITVGGMVDGRDISVDGDKLDLIEPGATADQTPNELLVALRSVDGSGSGLYVPLLDGQQGDYYQPVSSALKTSTQFGGDVSGTFNNIQVSDDSHNHVIPNVDGLQAALDSKQPASSVLDSIVASNKGSILAATTAAFTTELKNKLEADRVEIPTGAVKMWVGQNVPAGWLVCDGRQVSRSTYSDLFSVIGVRYGSGDGSTTFNLPDTVSKVIVGVSAGQSSVTGNSISSSLNSLSLGNESASHDHNETLSTNSSNVAHSHSVSITSGGSGHGHGGGNTGLQSSSHSHAYASHTTNSSTFNTTSGSVSSSHSHGVVDSTGAHSHGSSLTSNNTSTSHSHALNVSDQSMVGNHTHYLSSANISVSSEFFVFIVKT